MFQFEIHSKSILQLCNSDTYSKLSMLKRTSNWIMSGNPANSPTLLWIGLMQKHAMCIFARSKFRRLGSMPQSFLPPHTHRRQTFPQHQWQSCKHPCTSKAMSDMWSCIFKWLNRQMSASSFICCNHNPVHSSAFAANIIPNRSHGLAGPDLQLAFSCYPRVYTTINNCSFRPNLFCH